MNRETLRRLTGSLAFRLAVIALILYTVYHCVTAQTAPLTTDVVTVGCERRTVRGTGIIVRDEQPVTVDGGSYLISYPGADGARVNVDATVAEIFATYGDADTNRATQSSLLFLDRQIRKAKSVDTGRDTLASLRGIREEIREDILKTLAVATDGGALGEVESRAFSVLVGLSRDAALTGKGGSAEELISSLTAARRNLLGGVYSYGRAIGTGGQSGYFYYANRVDGYETVIRREDLLNLSVTTYDAWLHAEPVTYGTNVTVVGKIVRGFTWYLVLPVTDAVGTEMETGETYPVRFTGDGVTLRMTLESVARSVGDGEAYLVLSCGEMPEGFAFTRFSEVELTLGETEGYRVPETALREENGERGVYVFDGGKVSFRAIRIDFVGEGYVLAHIPTAEEKERDTDGFFSADHYLRERDVVITGGDDLYDGKYID